MLVVLGLAALALPGLASVATTVFVGWLFLVGGIAGLCLTIWARKSPGFAWGLVSALLGIVAGALLIGRPLQGDVHTDDRDGGILHHRRLFVDHVWLESPPDIVCSMGVDDRGRHRRFHHRRDDYPRTARISGVGHWSSCWHQFPFRRLLAHWDGTGCANTFGTVELRANIGRKWLGANCRLHAFNADGVIPALCIPEHISGQ